MSDVILAAAATYSQKARVALDMQISAEPEAQLTVPVSNLFSAVAAEAGIGHLDLVREAQLSGVRPDFAAVINGSACGWVELKKPGHSLDGTKWTGREKDQWSLLAELDALIVTDGVRAVLYNGGIPVTDEPVLLPMHSPEIWDHEPLAALLRLFVVSRPATINRVSQLAQKLAPLARLLRIRLQEGVDNSVTGFSSAVAAWDQAMQRKSTHESFATDVAQVLAYSMAIAALEGGADRDANGIISVLEAAEELHQGPHNVLAAALGPVLGIPALLTYVRAEIGGIERLVSSVDLTAIHRYKDPRGEPWLWFYEDFLAKYDPESRNKSGVYYTPTQVVQCQVRLVDSILRKRLDRSMGFAADSVTTLDPATGSGTYPLSIIDHAEKVMWDRRGPGGRVQAGHILKKNLIAFELLPGPYAVAQLRIGQRLSELIGQVPGVTDQTERLQVYLTDTLEDPSNERTQTGLFGDALVLSEQARQAREIKNGRQVTVVIGNPPYDRVTQESGGWITHPKSGPRLFDDVIKPAQEAGIIFSAQASLYDMYVYFWRWAFWKAFEEHPGEPAVVSFITPSNWLRGPAFVGLRELALSHGDEIWVVDLGGEGRGTRQEENVFDIQTPVAIVTVWRKRGGSANPAKVYYRKIDGSRSQKFTTLSTVTAPFEDKDQWQVIEPILGSPLAPTTVEGNWATYPALTDIFPWQGPGCKWNRMWTVAPSRDVLQRRWDALLEDDRSEVRSERFVTPTTGRNINTNVNGLPPINSLLPGSPPRRIVRYAWRSFDRQWAFEDPRLAALERPSLWNSLSQQQLFLVSMNTSQLGEGPALTAATDVPDLHYFCNRGGKDVLPLYRDRGATAPNLPAGLQELLVSEFDHEVLPEDIAAYVFALLAHPGYTSLFSDELRVPGARVPFTKKPDLFARAVSIGEQLLWLQTYAERYISDGRPEREVPHVQGLHWETAITTIPESPKSVSYDAVSHKLIIGDGVVTGVTPAMRAFSVSGMNVLDKWLGTRTATGIGRSAGARAKYLDSIRPKEWEDEWNDELLDLLRVLSQTLDLADEQNLILQTIIAEEMFTTHDFPTPSPSERTVPKSQD